MISFPVLEKLDIWNYGLFPGSDPENRGLHVEFQPGITLILGANGLGKTTLITIIYRLLTGPYDIPGLASAPDVGTMRLDAIQLSRNRQMLISQRVADGARSARARIEFRLGEQKVTVERRLLDLSLIRIDISSREGLAADESTYQSEILRLADVSSFGDWIMLLRHLTFYFEDRRALVWDASAQRQLLRLLFLPATTARKWYSDEREILELDTRMRNLSATVYREERALAKSEAKVQSAPDVREELETLEGLQTLDVEQRERINEELLETDDSRQSARLKFLTLEQDLEERYREVERATLISIGARFPDRSQTARYILAHLMIDEECLVCGSVAPAAATEYVNRMEHAQCVVCLSDLADSGIPERKIEEIDEAIGRGKSSLGAVENEAAAARTALNEAQNYHESLSAQLVGLNAKISQRSLRIDQLIGQLPAKEVTLHKQRTELGSMRGLVDELKGQLSAKRDVFQQFIGTVSRDIVTWSEVIKTSFNEYAEGFLLEKCRLIWAPQKSQVGQTGERIDYPAFELEMTGTDFSTATRRSGPEQVSESQREFIDLAFRMALMATAGSGGVGTLIIDAPESSLDAVFVSRAARVLGRFAAPERGNRLLITSNLIEGNLIPSLLKQSTTIEDRSSRIVDLLSIATPTAAVRELRQEYIDVRDALLSQVNGTDASRQ